VKILLWIDDNEQLIDASQPVFERHGFYVLKATNSSRALTVLRQHTVDGVLVDVRLSDGEDGLELLDDIHHRYPSLPLAVFTGYPAYADHVRAMRAGAQIYWEKVDKYIPLDPEKQRSFFEALHLIFPGQKTLRPTFQWRWLFAFALAVLGIAAVVFLPIWLSWHSLLQHEHRLGIQLSASAIIVGVCWIIADRDGTWRRVAVAGVIVAGFYSIAKMI
jgi:CheY-like chemotaxis protein